MKKVFALIDCNNFYCSCERVFNPKLRNRPVMVLSNNDGCIVARSNEVKVLGIPMGAPVYKFKGMIKQHDIAVLSSNFTLYADFSSRVMQTLAQFSPKMEIYSIDEAFLDLTDIHLHDYTEYARKIKQTVEKYTGISTSIGVANTKTLAKAANKTAKKDPSTAGVLSFVNLPEVQLDKYLEAIPIVDIWGIGRQFSKKLNMRGIYNARQLQEFSRKDTKKVTNVCGERTILELNGQSCINLQDICPPRKSIISSRSFGHPVSELEDLDEAVASYICIAGEKLRSQASVARYVTTYITTNPFRDEPHYAAALTTSLPEASNYTPDLIKAAHKNLHSIYRCGYRYKKAGVVITGITQANTAQMSILNTKETEKWHLRSRSLMKAVDILNERWGRSIVRTAAQGLDQAWRMKSEMRSPCYTTSWDDILRIKI